jgi:polysaccharide deacetylase family protein (PEP-CTERM system associated)
MQAVGRVSFGRHGMACSMTNQRTSSVETQAHSRASRGETSLERTHILTVSVEEYYHHGAFSTALHGKHWERLESRLERNVEDVLELFSRFAVKATFFVHGCSAERHPELVSRIVGAGHEVASRGYWPRGVSGLDREEFRSDLRRTRKVLEDAGANEIVGFRSARWLRPRELWILDVLAEEGYRYDSSVNPVLRRFRDAPEFYAIHRRPAESPAAGIWEFPVSTTGILGYRVPISGGNYLRQLPHSLLRRAVARWHRRREVPMVFYFMPWELDSHQPYVTSLSRIYRIKHYRNLAKTRRILEEYFQEFRFQSIRDYLGLELALRPRLHREAPAVISSAPTLPPREERPAVSIVVPLYNEEANINYFKQTITNLVQFLSRRYRIELVLVDDGSSDQTLARLRAAFGDRADCKILAHDRNRGVAAAILTGIRGAGSDIVCSMDCDCSYDPHELASMIPLVESADLVTASPYHPDGEVHNVPNWRLFLSRNLSRLYSALLGQKLYTYTSCFRVYRKDALEGLALTHDGFLGVAELLVRAKLAGARIAEYPTTLESRLFGTSKMKVVKTVFGHLGLIWQLFVAARFSRPRSVLAKPTRK